MLVKTGYRILFVLFATAILNYALAQDNTALEIEGLYQKAEQLFYLDHQTEITNHQALQHYQEIIELCQRQTIVNTILADSYLKSGVIHLIYNQEQEALLSYHQSLETLFAVKPPNDSSFFKTYVYLGDLHNKLENFDSAEYYYHKAEDIAAYWQNDIDEIERLYNSLGTMYYVVGNYQQAHNFLNKALSIAKKKYSDDLETQVYFKNNLAAASSKAGNYGQAIREYQDLLQYGFVTHSLYNNLGRMYAKKSSFDSAVFYLKKAVNSPSQMTNITVLNNLGLTYLASDLPDTAQAYFQQALALEQSILSSKSSDLAETYMGIAQIEQKRNNWPESLDNYQKAVISLAYDFADTSWSANPEQYNKVISLLHLFEAMQGKGKALYNYAQQDHDTIKLKNALACYQDAIRLAKHIQKSYDMDDAKLFFIEHIHPVFAEALAVAYTLYHLTGEQQYVYTGLAIAEAGKASVLSETLKDLEIKATGVIDDSLIHDEKRLKQKITSLRIKLAQSNDSTQNQAYQETITDLEIALAHTIKTLQQDKKYYQLKYQDDSLDLSKIQQQAIGSNAVALEYVAGEDAMYIFLIMKEKVELKRVSLTPAFNQALQSVQAHLYQYEAGQQYEEQKNTGELYRFLMQPFEDEIEGTDRLIIIPDGSLSYIPFEVLSRPASPDRYLIQDYAFNYAYSSTLLLEAIQHRNAKLANSVLAMAPFAGEDHGNIRSNGFNLLAASREEVENVGGSIYLEDKATKRLFLKIASSYGILHLATHASIDSENPLQSYIAFYPDQGESDAGYRLYTQELYNLRLDSVKLVVLSACEAGGGRLVHGEGIISLARAFAYAGCPNIVTTLWKAADKSSAEITSSMHKYLKEGYAKDEALRLAKIDYLNSDVHPIFKDPYYWANFIFIGDHAPIYTSYRFIWYILLGLAVIITFFWLLKRKGFIHLSSPASLTSKGNNR